MSKNRTYKQIAVMWGEQVQRMSRVGVWMAPPKLLRLVPIPVAAFANAAIKAAHFRRKSLRQTRS